MRYAWWIIFGLVLFLLCTQKALAYESEPFDPTAQYEVHSVPLVVQDSAGATFSENGNTLTPTPTPHKNPFINSTNKTPKTDSSVTPEAGMEAKQESQSETPFAVTTSVHESDHIDLTPLTYKAQQDKKNIFSKMSNGVSSFFSNVGNGIQNIFINPMKAGLSSIGSGVSSFFESVSSFMKTNVMSPMNAFLSAGKAGVQSLVQSVQRFSRPILTNVSGFVNSMTSAVVQYTSSYVHFISSHAGQIASVVFGTSAAIALFSTPIFKPIRDKAISFVVNGWVSMVDLGLHTGCAISGVASMLRNGESFTEGYERSKIFVKQKTGHDIGSFGQDFHVVAVRVVVVLVVFTVLPEILTTTVAATTSVVTTIAAESAPELALRGSYALSKTSTDCTMMAGQCDTPLGAGLTYGSNFVAGIAPNVAGLSSLADEEASEVGKVLGKADEVVQTQVLFNSQIDLTEEVLESRLTSEFIKENYGSINNPSFQEAFKKYPNAMRLINEEYGHILDKHLTDESYQIARSFKIDVASNFNSTDDLLQSIEAAVTDKKNIEEINNWVKNPERTVILRVNEDLHRVVGKNYLRENGILKVIDSHSVTIELKMIGNQIIINTGFPSTL